MEIQAKLDIQAQAQPSVPGQVNPLVGLRKGREGHLVGVGIVDQLSNTG